MSAQLGHGDCEFASEAAPYLLGALEAQEAESFSAHLEGCPICHEALVSTRPVVEALSTSVAPVKAPPELLKRIMVQVRSEAELLSAAGPDVDRARRRVISWRSSRLAGVAVGLALAAGVAIGVLVSGPASLQSRVYQGQVAATDLGARVELQQTGSRAQLIVADMPSPPSGEIYEVWLARGHSSKPEPTDALFGVDRRGAATVAIPGHLQGVQSVLVTAEPSGGTSSPTSEPVITVNLGA